MTIELRPDPRNPDVVMGVWRGVEPVGVVTVGRDSLVPRVALIVDIDSRVTRVELEEIVGSLARHMSPEGAFELAVNDPVIRHVARAAGFTGGCRVPLRAPASSSVALDSGLEITTASDLADEVNHLLGRQLAEPGQPRSRLARLAFTAASGNMDSLHLRVAMSSGGSFAMVVPEHPDLMPEVVALACDTAVGSDRLR